MLEIASYGAGLQSTAMLMANEHGLIDPPIERAIFADTGWEPARVHETLAWISSPNVARIPVDVVQNSDIREYLSTGEGMGYSAPFFLENGGQGRRQCTEKIKIRPIRKKLRELLGVGPRARIRVNAVSMSIGITTDEAARMTTSPVQYIHHRYPLIDLGWSKQDCIDWMGEHGYPIPAKSSCIGCPFHSNTYWIQLRENEPEEFADAVAVEKAMNETREARGIKHREFMHEDRIPLDEVDFKARGDGTNAFINECTGYCAT